jgi:hypothetical protein
VGVSASAGRGAATAPLDAYLSWALATDFRFVLTDPSRRLSPAVVGLLVEWNGTDAALRARKLIERSTELAEVKVADVYTGGRQGRPQTFWTLSMPPDRVRVFIDALAQEARRIELAGSASQTAFPTPSRLPPPCDEPVLFGLLDDGCAFANPRFQQVAKTRIRRLWNQDSDSVGDPMLTPPLNFGYGAQLFDTDLDALLVAAQQRAEQAYRDARLHGLRRAAVHGAHVLDLQAGNLEGPIVFVQFPHLAVEDPTGLWLDKYALDGLHYILLAAGPNTQRIVVNLSWGPQTGPHDGTSFLEQAIDALVQSQPAHRKLIVTLPAGNTFGAQAHAQVDCAGGGSVQWLLPPDGRMSAFVEVWWPQGLTPAQTSLTVHPPRATPVLVVPGRQDFPGWSVDLQAVGASPRALLSVNPTAGGAVAAGPCGPWMFMFGPTAASPVPIHLYLARANHNMGARRLGLPSRFTDAAYEASRFVAPAWRYVDAVGSAVRRAGSLNGIATGASTLVVGGYRLADKMPAPYSSSGASRGPRMQPDHACASDLSAAVPGLRAAGVRAGTVVRLVGTSSAAPQLGRILSQGSTAPQLDPPPPPSPPVRMGQGRLKPDPRFDRRK